MRAQLGRGQPCPLCPDDAQTDTLELLVSELVTNAVVHTGRPAVLRLRIGGGEDCGGRERPGADGSTESSTDCGGDGRGPERGSAAVSVPVRVEVADSSGTAPRVRHPAGEDTGGRGLELVELLADRWGWQREENGKRVWCELDCRAVRGAPRAEGKIPARY